MRSVNRMFRSQVCDFRKSVAVKARFFCSNLRLKLADWPGEYRVPINEILRLISVNEEYEIEAKRLNIDSATWSQFLSAFRRKLMKTPLEIFHDEKILGEFLNSLESVTVEDKLLGLQSIPPSIIETLFSVLISRAKEELQDEREAYKALCMKTDLRMPHEWYAYARLMKRKIIYHGGPTNSGKTYQALQRLREADPEKGGGLYCGPLRLLALEIYDNLNRAGVYCDLLTGQEKREVPFSTHTSCTVEMVNVNKDYDVAVIDEIQMIADQQRGYAWTRALLGLRAREIHVCGGADASDIVASFAKEVGDDFELKTYQRLSPLKIMAESLRGDYSKVRAGDCVVAFSRSDIFSIKREIERLTQHKCCTVYGQLPPETRSEQARLFNEEGTGYDVLVASDAIGMGLNLNIRRVIFHSVVKKGSPTEGSYFVDPSSVRQIAGRAGRLSSAYGHGEVTTWQDADLAYVRAAMEYELPQIARVGLFPSVDQIETFTDQLQLHESSTPESIDSNADADTITNPDETEIINIAVKTSSQNGLRGAIGAAKPSNSNIRLSSILKKFVELAQVDGRYFLVDHEDMVLISNWLHTIPLSLADRFTFANAPVSTRDRLSMNTLYQFAATYAQGRPVALNIRLPKYHPRDILDLQELCIQHNTLDLYLWLAIRFPKYFIEKDICLQQKQYAISLINDSLYNTKLVLKYDHVEDFKKLRKNMLEREGQAGLLPKQWPSVSEAMKKYLEEIPIEKRLVYPERSNTTSKPGVRRNVTAGESRRGSPITKKVSAPKISEAIV